MMVGKRYGMYRWEVEASTCVNEVNNNKDREAEYY